MSETLFLTDDDITAASDWKSAIEVLRRAYATPLRAESVPPRSMARGDGIWLRSLIAISPLDGHMGCKLISACLRSRKASYLISLFDQTTANLDALLDGNQITGIRTAATAVVAIDALAPKRPLRVAILGSGFEAKAQLTALLCAREVDTVKVFSPTPERRAAFALHFKNDLGVSITAVSDAPQAVEGCDLVVCAARAKAEAPILHGAWLEPGMTVTSIGSTLPEQREVDVTVVDRVDTIVADMPEEVSEDTGDMRAAKAAGVRFHHKVIALGDLLSERRPARSQLAEIVLYKSVGSALQDVVVAEMLLSRARALGRGTVLPVSISPVLK